jgi:lipopolysaccharide heptosyltransferase II
MRMGSERLACWREARNVLCLRLDNLGDVLMTSAALRALHADGARRITLLASSSGAAAARCLPAVADVLCYDAPWMKHDADSPAIDLSMIEAVRARGFDAAIVFTVYSQSALPAALFCRLAGIPLRLAHCRENPYRLLTDWVAETEPQGGIRHEVQRQLDLVATIGASTTDSRLRLEIPGEAHAAIEQRLGRIGIEPGEPLVVLHPGASADSRRYPAAQFAQAARCLARRHRCRILVTGSRTERDLAQTVCAGNADACSVAGELDFPELAALISRASLLISNNSGPVHVAAAVGTPVVVLYALTNPQHTPWQVPHRTLFRDVPCRYCYKSTCPHGHNACLRLVTPAEIAEAAAELLERPAQEPAPLPAAMPC